MWMPHAITWKHHYVRFFLLRIKKLFEVGDKLIKVELTNGKNVHYYFGSKTCVGWVGWNPFWAFEGGIGAEDDN